MCCLAGCTFQEIAAWLSNKGVKFPRKEQAPGSDGKVWKSITVEQFGEFRFKWEADKADPVMEKLYVYRRKDGTPYAFKMRFTPKNFRRFAFRPDGKIQASWAGIQMDPYNWDVACKAAAEGRPVVHVEGEKDSDSVTENLKYASFSIGGVSDHWNETWNEDLKGTKGIIFVADNDLVKGNYKEPGLKKASELCDIVSKVFPVKLMMFKDHKDSSDFISAGGTRKDFEKKVKDTALWESAGIQNTVPPDTSNLCISAEEVNHSGNIPSEPELAKKRSQKDILISCTDGIELWHDAKQKAYATIREGGKSEHLALDSRVFSDWLCLQYYRAVGGSPGREAVKECIGTLSGKAKFEGREDTAEVRIAHRPGKVYLDLVNKQREVVSITSTGWEILRDSDCPVKFIRPRTLRELPRPLADGDINAIFSIINVESEHQKTLLCAWLVSVFKPPSGVFPILVLTGEQGTGKTFAAKTIKQLIDPVEAPLRATPKEERDLAIAATSNYILAYDNLSGMPAWLSDVYCRVASGAGFSTRELFTDGEETTFETHSPILINGIDEPTSRDDFNDRVISIKLARILDTQRQTERMLQKRFEEIAPRVLGAILSAVSQALKEVDSVKIESQVRMADFLEWATAAEPALGIKSGGIAKSYDHNRTELVMDLIETSALAQAVIKLVEMNYHNGGICDTATKIFRQLVKPDDLDTSDFPKNPKQFGSKLSRLSPALRKVGIAVEKDRNMNSRLITLRDERK